VDSTVIARVPRDEIISNHRIGPGDVIVGLASSGQASYEKTYNSGIGSNGLTSARHDLLHKSVGTKYPESFDPEMPEDLSYTGSYHLTETLSGLDMEVGKLLLSPTRTYAPVMKIVLDNLRNEINGVVHCSGGAQTKILHFIDRGHIIKDNLFDVPPLFQTIQKVSGTSWKEMYQVFNMGHRMEIYIPEKFAQQIIDIAASFQIEAQIVGRVEDSKHKRLTISGVEGKYQYL